MRSSPAALLGAPAEILHQIFDHLAPTDLHTLRSASHRLWQVSRSRLLLCKMLLRGGWWIPVQNGLEAISANKDGATTKDQVTYLDDCLQREYSLQPGEHGRTSLVHSTTTDFNDLSAGESLALTISTCSQYLLVTVGRTIYIYTLLGSQFQPLTSIACPRNVIAVAMDCSGGGYTIAAILDGRMGLVCDLTADILQQEPPSPCVYGDRSLDAEDPRNSWISQEFYTELSSGNAGQVNSIHVRSAHQRVSLLNASQHTPLRSATMISRATTIAPYDCAPACAPYTVSIEPVQEDKKKTPIQSEDEPSILVSPVFPANTFPVSSAPFSVYHSLCSPNDPPRSVSVCAHRQCVAWGCKAGVELHWTDVMSGHNLMKWFPLTLPSDYLYFLPTRVGVKDDRIRIFCSEAGPGQLGSSRRCIEGTTKPNETKTSPIVRSLDHFAAVPLKDGQHFLFTEPSTGWLSVGSDSMLPTLREPGKMLRKITLVPPKDLQLEVSSNQPTPIYAASSDLTWGLRIAVVYGSTLVLHCVPPDVLADVAKVRDTAVASVEEEVEEESFSSWHAWWDFKGAPKGEKWPIPVQGSVIDYVPGLRDISVQGSSELVIWGLLADGTARTWEIGHNSEPRALQSYVDHGGMVHDSVDEDGDVIMRSGPPQDRPVHFGRDGIVELDYDGDVIMGNACVARGSLRFDRVEFLKQKKILEHKSGLAMSRLELFQRVVGEAEVPAID